MLKKNLYTSMALIVLLALVGCSNPAAPCDSPPVPGGTYIHLEGASATALTVRWGRATDDATAQEDLQYKLVRASSRDAINTVNKADAVSVEGIVMNWTTEATIKNGSNDLVKNVSGMSANTFYCFAVLVRDEAGNMSLYSPMECTTPDTADTDAPFIGTASVSVSGATISWDSPSFDNTLLSDLEYKLVRASRSEAINTVSEANTISGSDLLIDWTVDARSFTGASAGVYYAVLVRDAVGNMSLYTPVYAD